MLANSSVFIGELSLEGYIKGITGGLAMAMGARKKGISTIYTAPSIGSEIKSGFGESVVIADTLHELVNMITGQMAIRLAEKATAVAEKIDLLPDFKEVQGQVIAKKH